MLTPNPHVHGKLCGFDAKRLAGTTPGTTASIGHARRGRFHTCRFSVIGIEHCAVAESFGEPAVKRIVRIVSASAGIIPAALCAGQASLGWPEVIALLTKARTQATTCVQVLKSNGDKPSVAKAQLTYGMAEGQMDEVIAGLTIALIDGGNPDRLLTARTSLEVAGKGLKEICDAAVGTVTPNPKGVWEEIAKGAVEPLFKMISDSVGALWTDHVEIDPLDRATKKSALEAAKWPKFSDIAAQ